MDDAGGGAVTSRVLFIRRGVIAGEMYDVCRSDGRETP
jgi:hypothetical protein